MQETKNKKRKDNKTQTIKEILAVSSLAYLLSPFRSQRLLIKILWSLFLLIFFFLSTYYVVLNILDYLKYETTTSIQTIYEQESEFPTISFCSRNESNFCIEKFDFWFNNIEQFIDKDLKVYNDSSFGKCYRFNSGSKNERIVPIKTSKISGWDDGFQLSFYSNTSFDYGRFIILIHNHTQTPKTIYNKGHYISSGNYNYFIIKRIKDEKLEQPYNDCFKNVSKSEFNQTIISYLANKNYAYNQKDCITICENLKYNETNTCACYLESLDDDILMQCYYKTDNQTLRECVDTFMGSFNFSLCHLEYCPLECDSFEYDITFYIEPILSVGKISANIPDILIEKYSPEFKTYENVSKTFVSINVYYQDLKYTLISQQPKIELFGLISNLGGILGLFIGFSFISCLELIEILAELIYPYLKSS
jgi:hypothetical protein